MPEVAKQLQSYFYSNFTSFLILDLIIHCFTLLYFFCYSLASLFLFINDTTLIQ